MTTMQAQPFSISRMQAQETVVDWRDVLAVLRRRWLAVGATVALCTATAVAASLFVLPPVYQAEAVVRVRDVIDARPGQARTGAGAAPSLAEPRTTAEYARLMASPALLAKVAESARPTTVEELAAMVRVKPVRDTNLLSVTVRAADPQRAAEVANRLASRFVEGQASQDEARKDAYMKALQRQAADVSRRISALRGAAAAAEPPPGAPGAPGASDASPASSTPGASGAPAGVAGAPAVGAPGADAVPADGEAAFRQSEAYFQARMEAWKRHRQLIVDRQADINALRVQMTRLQAQGADAKALEDAQARLAALRDDLAANRREAARIEEEIASLVQQRTARQAREEEAKTLSALYLDLMRQVSAFELARQVAAAQPAAEVIAPAFAPSRPVSPDPLRNGAAAAVLSLAAALTVVFLAEGAARRRREREAVGRAAG